MQIKTTAGEFSEELETFAYSFNFGVCRTFFFHWHKMQRANCRCFITAFFFFSAFQASDFCSSTYWTWIPLTATIQILKQGKCEPLIALRPAAPAICWILTSTRPRLVHFIIFFLILFYCPKDLSCKAWMRVAYAAEHTKAQTCTAHSTHLHTLI